MPNIIGKRLASGKLPSTAGALYTCPKFQVATAEVVVYHNGGAGNNTVQLILRTAAGVDSVLSYQILATRDTLNYDLPIYLDQGDSLRGVATNASEVDYTIMGKVEDIGRNL